MNLDRDNSDLAPTALKEDPLVTVLFVDPGGGLGGAELVIDTLIRRSDSSRFRSVLACLQEGSWPEQVRNLGVEVRVFQRSRLRNICRVIRVVSSLTTLVLRQNVDIVHANHGTALVYGSIAARLGQARLVWHLHDPQSDHGMRRRLFLRLVRLLPPDHVLFASPVVQSSWLKLWPSLESRSSLVLPGVDISDPPRGNPGKARRDLGMPASAPVVSMFARPVRHKGHADLIRAAARVVQVVPEVRLVLCTSFEDPQMQSDLIRLREDLGLSDASILLPGPVWGTAKEDLLAATTVLVHPSWSEPFGLAILDGMAAGKPVVAYRTDGSQFLIRDGVDGILVEVKDIAALAEGIISLLLNRTRAEAMGVAARERARAFANDVMVEMTQATWKTVMSRRPSTHRRRRRC